MSKIINNINSFAREVVKGSSLRVTSQGDFYVNSGFVATAKRLLGLKRSNWVKVSRAFRNVLSQLESIPVTFNYSKSYAIQPVDFIAFIKAGNAILDKLSDFNSRKVNEEADLLKRELVALLYRMEEINGGLSPASFSEEDFDALVKAAQSWKSAQVVFDNPALSLEDSKILQDTCQYGEFTKLILSNKKLREDFFAWTLRDRIALEAFIEYPTIQQKLNDYDLNGRIGRGLLKVVKNQDFDESAGTFQKLVTLPFEGKDISILDDQRYVIFRGDYALTIQEVYEEFRKKRNGSSNLEVMGDGIINWNSFYWGWWDERVKEYHVVDLDKPDWWKQLPGFEVLSLREARARYGNHLDGRQWNVAAIATRERATLDFEDAHAYSSLAMPIGEGRYAIFPFGKYAREFPATLLEALCDVGHTSDATVAFPDENVFYTHRQSSHFSFAINEEQGLAYLESVKRDMLTARAGNLVYQIESENCAKWAHQKIEEIVGPHRMPNVFQMPFLNSEPHGFMEKVFYVIKLLPEKWQVSITLAIHFMLGSYKGLWIWEEGEQVWKSLTYHPFWKDTVIYHPSMLIRQQELGVISRCVSQGITFTKQHIRRSFHGLFHKMVLFADYIANEAQKALKSASSLMRKLLLSKATQATTEEGIILVLSQHPENGNEIRAEERDPQINSSRTRSDGMKYALNKGLGINGSKGLQRLGIAFPQVQILPQEIQLRRVLVCGEGRTFLECC